MQKITTPDVDAEEAQIITRGDVAGPDRSTRNPWRVH